MQEKRSPNARPGHVSEQILREVESRGVLPAQVAAMDAVAAVMCVLAQRLSGGEAGHLVEAMPDPLQAMVRPCAAHFERPEPFERGEFLARVSEHLQVEHKSAGNITKAVFTAVRYRLSPKEINDVLSQLPQGLKEWWGPPAPLKIAAGLGLARPDAATATIVDEIESRTVLAPEISAADAAAAVMCVLAQRLSGHEARHLLELLPATLRAMLQPCTIHYEQPEVFTSEEFFLRVEQHLRIEKDMAERVVRIVFAAVEKQLSPEEIEQVAAQLPGDLKRLWGTAASIRPPEGDPAFEAITRELESLEVLPPAVPAADAAVQVMCVLAQRLSSGEARHLAALVPVAMRDALRPCVLHLEEPEIFDREEFFARVSPRVNVDRNAAEEITKRVFAAVKKQLPAQEVRHVLGQLPKEMEELWGGFVLV